MAENVEITRISSCEETDACKPSEGTRIKTNAGRIRPKMNKRSTLFLGRLTKEVCKNGSNDRVVTKDNVFPDDYLIPTNLSNLHLDLQAQNKEMNVANSSVGYNYRTGYKPKITFDSIQDSGAWGEYLTDYTVDLPIGDDAEVDGIFVYDFVGLEFDSKGKVTGAEGLKAIHFTGPLDIDNFGASGEDEDVVKVKGTIDVNFTLDKIEIKPKNKGGFNKLVTALYNGTGINSAWSNDCVTKLK